MPNKRASFSVLEVPAVEFRNVLAGAPNNLPAFSQIRIHVFICCYSQSEAREPGSIGTTRHEAC